MYQLTDGIDHCLSLALALFDALAYQVKLTGLKHASHSKEWSSPRPSGLLQHANGLDCACLQTMFVHMDKHEGLERWEPGLQMVPRHITAFLASSEAECSGDGNCQSSCLHGSRGSSPVKAEQLDLGLCFGRWSSVGSQNPNMDKV